MQSRKKNKKKIKVENKKNKNMVKKIQKVIVEV